MPQPHGLAPAALAAELARLREDCAEAYQVVGSLAALGGLFDHPLVRKALDNLDAAAAGRPRPHADLLPFAPDAAAGPAEGTP